MGTIFVAKAVRRAGVATAMVRRVRACVRSLPAREPLPGGSSVPLAARAGAALSSHSLQGRLRLGQDHQLGSRGTFLLCSVRARVNARTDRSACTCGHALLRAARPSWRCAPSRQAARALLLKCGFELRLPPPLCHSTIQHMHALRHAQSSEP